MARELPGQFEEFGEARQKGFLKVKNIKDNGGKVRVLGFENLFDG